MRRPLLLLAWLAMTCSVDERAVCTAIAPESRPDVYWVQPLRTQQWITARVPQGRFVLLRDKEGHLFAVRFTHVSAAPGEGEGCGCARYEVYDPSRSGRPLLCAGEVSQLRSRGVHPIVWNAGNQRMACLPRAVAYEFPTQLLMTSRFEVALTRWSSVEAVNPRHPALRWFGPMSGNDEESAIEISPDELPR